MKRGTALLVVVMVACLVALWLAGGWRSVGGALLGCFIGIVIIGAAERLNGERSH